MKDGHLSAHLFASNMINNLFIFCVWLMNFSSYLSICLNLKTTWYNNWSLILVYNFWRMFWMFFILLNTMIRTILWVDLKIWVIDLFQLLYFYCLFIIKVRVIDTGMGTNVTTRFSLRLFHLFIIYVYKCLIACLCI